VARTDARRDVGVGRFAHDVPGGEAHQVDGASPSHGSVQRREESPPHARVSRDATSAAI
jgi:hypothetical protein